MSAKGHPTYVFYLCRTPAPRDVPEGMSSIFRLQVVNVLTDTEQHVDVSVKVVASLLTQLNHNLGKRRRVHVPSVAVTWCTRSEFVLEVSRMEPHWTRGGQKGGVREGVKLHPARVVERRRDYGPKRHLAA